MHLSEIERRDQVLRTYFRGRNWDTNSEYALNKSLSVRAFSYCPGTAT